MRQKGSQEPGSQKGGRTGVACGGGSGSNSSGGSSQARQEWAGCLWAPRLTEEGGRVPPHLPRGRAVISKARSTRTVTGPGSQAHKRPRRGRLAGEPQNHRACVQRREASLSVVLPPEAGVGGCPGSPRLGHIQMSAVCLLLGASLGSCPSGAAPWACELSGWFLVWHTLWMGSASPAGPALSECLRLEDGGCSGAAAGAPMVLGHWAATVERTVARPPRRGGGGGGKTYLVVHPLVIYAWNTCCFRQK